MIPRLRPSDDTYTERAFGVSADLASAHGACVCASSGYRRKSEIFGNGTVLCNGNAEARVVVFNNNQGIKIQSGEKSGDFL